MGPRTEGAEREWRWLREEVEAARDLTDRDRIQILDDLVWAAEAIRRGKTADELARAEEVRRRIDEPGRLRYRRWAERFG